MKMDKKTKEKNDRKKVKADFDEFTLFVKSIIGNSENSIIIKKYQKELLNNEDSENNA